MKKNLKCLNAPIQEVKVPLVPKIINLTWVIIIENDIYMGGNLYFVSCFCCIEKKLDIDPSNIFRPNSSYLLSCYSLMINEDPFKNNV